MCKNVRVCVACTCDIMPMERHDNVAVNEYIIWQDMITFNLQINQHENMYSSVDCKELDEQS